MGTVYKNTNSYDVHIGKYTVAAGDATVLHEAKSIPGMVCVSGISFPTQTTSSGSTIKTVAYGESTENELRILVRELEELNNKLLAEVDNLRNKVSPMERQLKEFFKAPCGPHALTRMYEMEAALKERCLKFNPDTKQVESTI